MPLSEDEKNMFAQLEAQLRENDPKFYQEMQKNSGKQVLTGKNIVIGSLVIAAGLAVLFTGVLTKLIIIGILGFLIMGSGGYLFSAKKVSVESRNPDRQGDFNEPQHKRFMKNLEDKWDERKRNENM